jgi:hypothetical protein
LIEQLRAAAHAGLRNLAPPFLSNSLSRRSRTSFERAQRLP